VAPTSSEDVSTEAQDEVEQVAPTSSEDVSTEAQDEMTEECGTDTTRSSSAVASEVVTKISQPVGRRKSLGDRNNNELPSLGTPKQNVQALPSDGVQPKKASSSKEGISKQKKTIFRQKSTDDVTQPGANRLASSSRIPRPSTPRTTTSNLKQQSTPTQTRMTRSRAKKSQGA